MAGMLDRDRISADGGADHRDVEMQVYVRRRSGPEGEHVRHGQERTCQSLGSRENGRAVPDADWKEHGKYQLYDGRRQRRDPESTGTRRVDKINDTL